MAVHTNQTRRRSENGTALVEFAIGVPLFCALVLGMFSGGLAYNQRMQLTHAAREGARYGATLPGDYTDTANPAVNWATKVRDVVVNRSSGDLTNAQVCVALVTGNTGTVVKNADTGTELEWRSDTTGFPTKGCFVDSNTDDGDRVHVAVRRNAQIQWMVASSNITLKGQATAKHE